MVTPNIDLDQVAALCASVKTLLSGLRALESRGVANPGSPAMSEWVSFQNPAQLRVAYDQAFLCNEVAAEHLEALAETITSQRLVAVPFSCLRVELEAAASSLWLLEEGIGAELRAKRGFAVRYQALRQQRAFAESAKKKTWTLSTPDWDATIAKIDDRIDDLEKDAKSVGIDPILDRNGKRIGLGTSWPGSTELVKQVFGVDAELHYRIGSAVVHSSPAQLLGLTFGEATDPVAGGKRVVKSVPAVVLAALCQAGLECFARSTWANAVHLSADKAEIAALLDVAYDAFGLKDDRYFWR